METEVRKMEKQEKQKVRETAVRKSILSNTQFLFRTVTKVAFVLSVQIAKLIWGWGSWFDSKAVLKPARSRMCLETRQLPHRLEVSLEFFRSIEHETRNTHTRLMALCPGLPGWAGTRKVKPIWILLKQETASGSGISWAVCKSAPRSRQITTPAPHHSVFYRPDALPATQPTASKH